MKNRGEVVRAAIEKSGLSKTDVARKMKVSRQALYDWFEIPNLSWDRIFEIGDIIKHDFAYDFPELKKLDSMVREPMVYTHQNEAEIKEKMKVMDDIVSDSEGPG